MTGEQIPGRLSILQAAFVIARRDFLAVLLSRSFLFFLLGPLFPVIVGIAAGGIGHEVAQETNQPQIGLAMTAADNARMLDAYRELAPRLGTALPEMVELAGLAPGETFDAAAELDQRRGNLAAIVTGSLTAPVLTATKERLDRWAPPVGLLAARAQSALPASYPEVATVSVATSGAQEKRGRAITAQAAQTMLFLLIMLLAGMVLSNLVEEKGNKVIEILAAAIPMDAVFLGKLFAMLGVSFVGIAVWGSFGGLLSLLAGPSGPLASYFAGLPDPGVGWPLFLALGVIYFAMGYLLLGSIFLAIGSMATTVREVQTLSMPVTMFQLVVFFLSNYALTRPGTGFELGVIAFPLSSPFVMLARAAQDEAVWPHLAAIAWQVGWVWIFVRAGAALFRKRVMKSGPQGARRSVFSILRGPRAG